MANFELFEPKSIDETVALLSKYAERAKVLAGGTDLLVKLKQGKVNSPYVIDLKTIPGLDQIGDNGQKGLRLGALNTIRTLEQSAVLRQRCPIISQAASQLGHVAIRNIATVGGNLCNAIPSADMAPSLVGLSASAIIAGPKGERIVPLEEFFISSGKTALQAAEFVTGFQIPALPANTKGTYLKYTARAVGLPIVGVAVIATLEPTTKTCRDVKIVVGNVAPTPMRARQAEEILKGKQIDESLMDKSAQAVADEAHPRAGSVRASPEYKKEMARVFTRRALMEVVS
jgi:CO/xanthine dehydrogenase FAD-binding subunit